MTSETENQVVCEKTAIRDVVDYDRLMPAFIGHEVAIKFESVPQDIVDLCVTFANSDIFDNEAKDPVNVISDHDREQCDRYKEEGNRYYNAKEYKQAVIKYTTALRFNPSNHLVYSNRGYCHFLLSEYQAARDNIEQCIQIQPTFCKGWYRYGLILEQLGFLELAGLAFKTAWLLTIEWNDSIMDENAFTFDSGLRAICASKARQFRKSLENDPIRQQAIIALMDDANSRATFMDDVIRRYTQQINGIESMEKSLDSAHLDIQEKLFEMIELKKTVQFIISFHHAKLAELVVRNIFDVIEEPYSFYDYWSVQWTSTKMTDRNKREFSVMISAGYTVIHEETVYGQPTAQQVIDILLKCITCSNQYWLFCTKPRNILFAWRMHQEFTKVSDAMARVGVACHLQIREDAVKICNEMGTDINGYNH